MFLVHGVQLRLGGTVQVVRSLIKAADSVQTAAAMGKKGQKHSATGFQILPRRWVVERSLAWITRWRRLTHDHEGLPQSSEAFIKLSASRRMLSLLAPPFL